MLISANGTNYRLDAIDETSEHRPPMATTARNSDENSSSSSKIESGKGETLFTEDSDDVIAPLAVTEYENAQHDYIPAPTEAAPTPIIFALSDEDSEPQNNLNNAQPEIHYQQNKTESLKDELMMPDANDCLNTTRENFEEMLNSKKTKTADGIDEEANHHIESDYETNDSEANPIKNNEKDDEQIIDVLPVPEIQPPPVPEIQPPPVPKIQPPAKYADVEEQHADTEIGQQQITSLNLDEDDNNIDELIANSNRRQNPTNNSHQSNISLSPQTDIPHQTNGQKLVIPIEPTPLQASSIRNRRSFALNERNGSPTLSTISKVSRHFPKRSRTISPSTGDSAVSSRQETRGSLIPSVSRSSGSRLTNRSFAKSRKVAAANPFLRRSRGAQGGVVSRNSAVSPVAWKPWAKSSKPFSDNPGFLDND
ncbi:unnamed protein product [Anisakis simplex]|uniref:DUF4005 domain-containing protein n=1 Tax=Anisakis simplex TaxID=6269 RepID=A0A0M3JU81_ANISI|nr:unnamed protein product [Anisakis simplex]